MSVQDWRPFRNAEVSRLLEWFENQGPARFCPCMYCQYPWARIFRELRRSERERLVHAFCSMNSRDWIVCKQSYGLQVAGLLPLLFPHEFELFIDGWVRQGRFSAADVRIMASISRSAAPVARRMRRAMRYKSIPDDVWDLRENFLLHPRLRPAFIGELLREFPDRKRRLQFFPLIAPVADQYPELAGAHNEWQRREARATAERLREAEAWHRRESAELRYREEITDELRSMGLAAALKLVGTERSEWQAWFPSEWLQMDSERVRDLDSVVLEAVMDQAGLESRFDRLRRAVREEIRARNREKGRAARARLLDELQSLSIGVRMQRIADGEHGLTYYPTAWARQFLAERPPLPAETVRALLALGRRVHRNRHRDWRRVVACLRQGKGAPAGPVC